MSRFLLHIYNQLLKRLQLVVGYLAWIRTMNVSSKGRSVTITLQGNVKNEWAFFLSPYRQLVECLAFRKVNKLHLVNERLDFTPVVRGFWF